MLQAETDHAVESRQLSHAWYDQTLSERNIHPQADRGVPHYADGEWSRYLIGVAAIVRKGGLAVYPLARVAPRLRGRKVRLVEVHGWLDGGSSVCN